MAGAGTPDREVGTPDREVETADRGAGTPDRGAGTPDRGVETPDRGVETADRRVALAVDVGGTKLEAALVSADGSVVVGTRSRRDTGPAANFTSLRAAIDAVVAHALAGLGANTDPAADTAPAVKTDSDGNSDPAADTAPVINTDSDGNSAPVVNTDSVGNSDPAADTAPVINTDSDGNSAPVVNTDSVVNTAPAADTDRAVELIGAGVGSAGPIDREHGKIIPVNMPDARGFDLRGAVRDAASAIVGSPVRTVFGHDGGCLALAESWLGATRGARASLSIVVSTGVGGGFVIDGHYLPGASGNAGHLGQVHATPELTLEEVASGPASVSWARTQGWTGERGEDLARDAAAGDPIARAAIERSARAVGAALADAATLVDLEVVAIGGGFSRVSEDYIDVVQAALTATAAHGYSRRTRVVRSALGDEGPLIGAAALVLR